MKNQLVEFILFAISYVCFSPAYLEWRLDYGSKLGLVSLCRVRTWYKEIKYENTRSFILKRFHLEYYFESITYKLYLTCHGATEVMRTEYFSLIEYSTYKLFFSNHMVVLYTIHNTIIRESTYGDFNEYLH